MSRYFLFFYMRVTGRQLKSAIKGKYTQEEAANALGVSRQTFNGWLTKAELNEDVVENVKTVLEIELTGYDNELLNGDSQKRDGYFDSDQIYNDSIQNDVDERYTGILMYNFPGSASTIQMYQDERDVRPVGRLNIPGAVKGSFALPVYGHSMYRTLENGNWCILRPLSDTTDIEFGEVYYIEYGDYRMYKRLIQVEDDPESVLLWSDNQTELVAGRPKYAAKKIRVERIKRLCLLTEILRKPNY